MESGYHAPVLNHSYDGRVMAIDAFMHGWEGITAVYHLPGPRPALIETGPATSLKHVLGGLDEIGVDHLDWIVLTHIHLDHAGAVGHLARRFPEAKIVVREEGARHLVDPSKLWASAGRIYPDMEGLWGEMIPVAQDRIVAVSEDGPVADLGDGRTLTAIYTPGHASHHMSLWEPEAGDLFVGDAVGVYLPDAGTIRPATPPPEFNLELMLASMDKLRAIRPTTMFPTHFGAVPDADAAFEEGARRLQQWVEVARRTYEDGMDIDAMTEAFKAARPTIYPDLSPEMADKFDQTSSYAMNAMGIARYLRKRTELSA